MLDSYKAKLVTQLARVRLFGHGAEESCLQCRRRRNTHTLFANALIALDRPVCTANGRDYRVCRRCYGSHWVFLHQFPDIYLKNAYDL